MARLSRRKQKARAWLGASLLSEPSHDSPLFKPIAAGVYETQAAQELRENAHERADAGNNQRRHYE